MRKPKRLAITQKGDTIVEILFCIAAISLVLIVTYTTINGSYLRFEETQERSRAVQLASSQIEALRSFGSAASNSCFQKNVAGTTVTPQTNFGAQGSNPCILDSSGKQVLSASTQPAYNVKITNASGTYSINVSWQSFHIQDSTSLEYRLQ